MTALSMPLEDTELRSLIHELGAEAACFRFDVAPNPCVGAAILSRGKVIARGYHERWGGDHAEVEALEAAARSGVPRAEWDTLVVTLEPCSTRGKTGPCTQAIMEAGIESVVIGAVDPDPRHQGQGIRFLEDAGLETRLLMGAAPIEDVTSHFLDWICPDRRRRPQPWVVAKWAQTATGQLSPPKDHGDGRTISSPESLEQVQHLRASVDAILTGVGTVVADDPRLTVRTPARTLKAPDRIILDSGLRTSPDARLFDPPEAGESAGPIRVLCTTGPDRAREKALIVAGAGVYGMRGDDRRFLNLRGVMTWMWEMGYRRVLLESGPTLLEACFDAGFVDQIRVVTGPVRGGRGESLGSRLQPGGLGARRDEECGSDSVLDAFIVR
ncbi:MAG: bifunctional diaminohydroxyphosphoribosylaminopyrimidine deaminase/5-amino-6-(5-phosphoribosylamino)uracil reductase RibD [Planctomycetota bacterium]|nr:bifunctional diaminohydroxyphosphoribosylaminopyrimidine deaminase/5-amino-6-(5-phosphoribosylamino)uracil reductase RibD [Planctomycetota bacterium]MDP6938908.1 bifunctional diaminohydroxyphosphoribosylaminopyrimidine deaminase/5-amino-6-(5-phosphoribosylamino)uracil reductase RibD [Planctomycetota bacterium]